jgi:ribosomal RNA-processing protein 7
MLFVKDFRILTLSQNLGGSHHFLYVKEHVDASTSKKSKGRSRVLFVGNVDIFGAEMMHDTIYDYMQAVFGGFGEIESISVSQFNNSDKNESMTASSSSSSYSLSNTDNQHQSSPSIIEIKDDKKHRNARFAHVTFTDRSIVKAILEASDKIYESIGRNICKEGWGISLQSISRKSYELAKLYPLFDINVNDIRENINKYLRSFEDDEDVVRREAIRRAREPDEDGFITAGPKKKSKRIDNENANKRGNGSTRSRKDKKAKNKDRELKNFYRFQIKEQKRQELVDLRKKFDLDREKIAEMKTKKAFNPLA